MSHAADFAQAVGGTLAHVTAASNLAAIEREGLRSAHDLAIAAGVDPATLRHRNARIAVGRALINHQMPFLAGMKAARRVLKDHTPESWAEQLDRRIFFWPARGRSSFEASIETDIPTAVLYVDAKALAEAFPDHIDLCALNSGSFRQIPATGNSTIGLRGDWIYRPLNAGVAAFGGYRRSCGLVQGKDKIKEVSLRCAIPPDILRSVQIKSQGAAHDR